MKKMKNKKTYESFVYRWTNKENGRVYIGKHCGSPDDGYIASGEYFRMVYDKNPDNFYREILFYGDDPFVLRTEYEMIAEHRNEFGPASMYNKSSYWDIQDHLSEYYIICPTCEFLVNKKNEELLEIFHKTHSKPICNPKKVLSQIEKMINILLDLQQISSTKERGDEIRRLRGIKSRLYIQ